MKDRIKQFIDHKLLSVREFERNCGTTNGLIKNMEKSFDKKVSTEEKYHQGQQLTDN